MFKRILFGVLIAIHCAGELWCAEQSPLTPVREIRLPVSSSRGNWIPLTDAARQNFAMRLAPDQSLLVFDSDISGNWSFVRIRRWWADAPVSEVIQVPAWSSADAKHLSRVFVDIQVTSDGRYAAAFAGAEWMDKSEFIFHVPRSYLMRQTDTIITVIDLDRWQIVKTCHTAPLASVVSY